VTLRDLKRVEVHLISLYAISHNLVNYWRASSRLGYAAADSCLRELSHDRHAAEGEKAQEVLSERQVASAIARRTFQCDGMMCPCHFCVAYAQPRSSGAHMFL
jgi:hypothetical protein